MPTFSNSPNHPLVISLLWSPSGIRWQIGAIGGGRRGDEPLRVATSPVAYRSAIHAYREGCAARARYNELEAA